MLYDFHVHTKYSVCSNNEPKKMIKKFKKLGYTGFAITDHNTIEAHKHFKGMKDLIFIPGEEIKVYEGKKCVGELIGLFVNESVGEKKPTVDEAIDLLRQQGALIIIPHPFDYFRENFKYINKYHKKVDAIEVFNSRCYLKRFNEKALKFAKEKNLGMSGGSDAHTIEEIGNMKVYLDGEEENEIRKKIKKGEIKIEGKPSGLIPHIKTFFIKHGFFR